MSGSETGTGVQRGGRLSVVELRGVCALLLVLLVVLHAFEPLPGEVFEDDVVVTGGDTRDRGGLFGARVLAAAFGGGLLNHPHRQQPALGSPSTP